MTAPKKRQRKARDWTPIDQAESFFWIDGAYRRLVMEWRYTDDVYEFRVREILPRRRKP